MSNPFDRKASRQSQWHKRNKGKISAYVRKNQKRRRAELGEAWRERLASMQYSNEQLASEVWKPVVGWEGVYEVSNLSRVKRLARINGAGYQLKEKLVALHARGGYIACTLNCDGFRMHPDVHTLVAAAFLGPCPKGLEVGHIDGDRMNNSPANLHYVSRAENLAERVEYAGRIGPSKLSLEQATYALREMLAAPVKIRRQRELAAEFGVSVNIMQQLWQRRTWQVLDCLRKVA